MSENQDDWWSFDTSHVGLGDITVSTNGDPRDLDSIGAWFCYYFGGDYNEDSAGRVGTAMKIGVAVSQDGINWCRVEGGGPTGEAIELDEEGENDRVLVGWPQVINHSNEEFRMYYSTYHETSGTWQISLATSSDGLLWTKKGPVFKAPDEKENSEAWDCKGVHRHHIIRKRSGDQNYVMFYEGINKEGIHAIGLASSGDGIHWKREGSSPIFEANRSEENAWDCSTVGR